ncbi:MAG: AAA family ATPase [Clostridia bacterium]|nr:AAA family ATPase [Clostridia bacterium]
MEKLYYDSGIIPRTSAVTDRIVLKYNELNYCLNSLILDRITLLIAPSNVGKSCFSSSIIIDAVSQGINTLLFAGEDGGAEARDRLYRQYLGSDKSNYDYIPYVLNGKNTNAGENIIKEEKFNEANEFFKNKLFIYNNNVPATKSNLLDCLERAYSEQGCRFFVLDNCEMFNLDEGAYSENQAMKDICIALRQFAISKKCHLLIISHIKKTERNICRPEIFDCKGTSSLTNIAKNILSLIRVDTLNPNTKEYKELMKLVELNGYDPNECSTIVEILKTKGRKNAIISMGFNAVSNSYYERRKKNEQINNETDGEQKSVQQPILFTPVENKEDFEDIFD